mmetsp:Transcript_13932/g.43175  ORF Transcript_13932/g.43175 Transcript_13932/m.43175 type:complete len:260 (+) Transcript_13932:84-863(+)
MAWSSFPPALRSAASQTRGSQPISARRSAGDFFGPAGGGGGGGGSASAMWPLCTMAAARWFGTQRRSTRQHRGCVGGSNSRAKRSTMPLDSGTAGSVWWFFRPRTRFFASAASVTRCTTSATRGGPPSPRASAWSLSQSSRCWSVWLQRSITTRRPRFRMSLTFASHLAREPRSSWQTTKKPFCLSCAASRLLPEPGKPQSTTVVSRGVGFSASCARSIMNRAPDRSQASSACFSHCGFCASRALFLRSCRETSHSAMV